MGANSPSTTPYARKVIDSIEPLFESLPLEYQQAFETYSEYILNSRVAIHYSTEQLPILTALVVIQVERDLAHAAEINELYRRLDDSFREITELNKRIAELCQEIRKPTNPK